MVIVRLKGGLGNQMFQYAAGKGVAVRNHTALKIDLSWYSRYQSPDTPAWRFYELDCFSFEPVFAGSKDLGRVNIAPHTFKRRIYRTIAGKVMAYYESDDDAHFHAEILQAGNNSFLEGFWQSEKYFADIAEVIKKDFTFKSTPAGENAKLAKQIASTNSVSLHVRRGDYVSHPQLAAMHGTVSLKYYQKSVATIAREIKTPHFYVISDDPEWCKQNLKLDFPTTYIDHNTKGFEDMRLMSLCQHNIIANSSFSWWAAWLNANPKKIICAPKKWFNNDQMDIKDRLPDSWIKL